MAFRMTEMEKLHLIEQLRAENVCLAKTNFYAEQFTDPALKQLCTQLRDKTQQHVNSLTNLLSQAGFQVQAH